MLVTAVMVIVVMMVIIVIIPVDAAEERPVVATPRPTKTFDEAIGELLSWRWRQIDRG